MANETEHLLMKLAEECAEVIKACTKAMTYGLDDTWDPASGLPQWSMTPRQEINHELNDVVGVSEMLRQRGILPQFSGPDFLEVEAKIKKVEALMPYAVKAGTLCLK